LKSHFTKSGHDILIYFTFVSLVLFEVEQFVFTTKNTKSTKKSNAARRSPPLRGVGDGQDLSPSLSRARGGSPK